MFLKIKPKKQNGRTALLQAIGLNFSFNYLAVAFSILNDYGFSGPASSCNLIDYIHRK